LDPHHPCWKTQDLYLRACNARHTAIHHWHTRLCTRLRGEVGSIVGSGCPHARLELHLWLVSWADLLRHHLRSVGYESPKQDNWYRDGCSSYLGHRYDGNPFLCHLLIKADHMCFIGCDPLHDKSRPGKPEREAGLLLWRAGNGIMGMGIPQGARVQR
jgi:hypothetical protein